MIRLKYSVLAAVFFALVLFLIPQNSYGLDTQVNEFSSSTFSDVTPGSWFYCGVKDAYESGLMGGIGNNRFDPNSNFTLAQAISVAARMYALYNDDTIDTSASGAWYEPYIQYASDHGLLNDTLENTADPNSLNATRAQAAFLFYGVLSNIETKPLYINTSTIPDLISVPIDYTIAVGNMFRMGIFTGMANGNFDGNAFVTRAQIAVIISRILDPSDRIPYDSYYNNELTNQAGNLFMDYGVIVYNDQYTYFVVANNDGSGKCNIVSRDNATMKAKIIYAGNGKISNLRMKDGSLYFIESLSSLHDMNGYTQRITDRAYLIQYNLTGNYAACLYKSDKEKDIFSFELYGEIIFINVKYDTKDFYNKIIALYDDGSTVDAAYYSNIFGEGQEIFLFNDKLYFVSAYIEYQTYDYKSNLYYLDLNKNKIVLVTSDFNGSDVCMVNGILYVMEVAESGNGFYDQVYKMNLVTDTDYASDKELVFDATGKNIGPIVYSVINGTMYVAGSYSNKIYKVLGDGSIAVAKDTGIPPMNFIVTGKGEFFYLNFWTFAYPFYYAPGFQYSNGIAAYLGVGGFNTANAVKSLATGQ